MWNHRRLDGEGFGKNASTITSVTRLQVDMFVAVSTGRSVVSLLFFFGPAHVTFKALKSRWDLLLSSEKTVRPYGWIYVWAGGLALSCEMSLPHMLK